MRHCHGWGKAHGMLGKAGWSKEHSPLASAQHQQASQPQFLPGEDKAGPEREAHGMPCLPACPPDIPR